ncbi:hypothetical protein BESB_034670 [Besnoitia besnoiti]|uniref:Transmembrane protein n=1 Tax=Besnoitia besnoiti TaxID=94643 RepID=A0A2A9MGG6_BESBE|nr:hypothetical protein BESB_034670 [Besnoitia besnoiti]PFH37009.1 hypothetical protein BESB_034670 [Besnoitia besnoiti]
MGVCALVIAATAEVAVVASLSILRGIWMTVIQNGSSVHLGLAASLHAVLRQLGAAILPALMLKTNFTTATRLFLFLHACFLLLLSVTVGADLPSFYAAHALTGLVSCTAASLLNWSLLTSRDPEEQLQDFSNFQKAYSVGPIFGSGICAVFFIGYELWARDVALVRAVATASVDTVRAVLGIQGIVIAFGFLVQFTAPHPSRCVSVRAYTYEDLMDALTLSKNWADDSGEKEATEATSEQEKRRVSLQAGMPILNVTDDGKRITRHLTGRFDEEKTTAFHKPRADKTIFDLDSEDEQDQSDRSAESDDCSSSFSSSVGSCTYNVDCDRDSVESSHLTSSLSSTSSRRTEAVADSPNQTPDRKDRHGAEYMSEMRFTTDAALKSTPAVTAESSKTDLFLSASGPSANNIVHAERPQDNDNKVLPRGQVNGCRPGTADGGCSLTYATQQSGTASTPGDAEQVKQVALLAFGGMGPL